MVTDDGREAVIQVLQETEKGSDHKKEAMTEREIGSMTGLGLVTENDLPGTGTVTNAGIGVVNVIGGETSCGIVYNCHFRSYSYALSLPSYTRSRE
jgi:hypothetical protein